MACCYGGQYCYEAWALGKSSASGQTGMCTCIKRHQSTVQSGESAYQDLLVRRWASPAHWQLAWPEGAVLHQGLPELLSGSSEKLAPARMCHLRNLVTWAHCSQETSSLKLIRLQGLSVHSLMCSRPGMCGLTFTADKPGERQKSAYLW